MKKRIMFIYIFLFLFTLCSCGNAKREVEDITKINESIINKSFLFQDELRSTKYEDPYYTIEGKSVNGGSYQQIHITEILVTFNADGTADYEYFGASKVKTNFNQEQERYSDVEDNFHSSVHEHHCTYVVQRDEDKKDDKNRYDIVLIENEEKVDTIGVVLSDDGTCRLWNAGYEMGVYMEETTITSLPSKDYSK